MERWKQLKILLNKAYKREEEYWSKTARVAKGGEKNTKYFHAITTERRKRNRIEMRKSNYRTECSSEKEIVGEIVRYFESLFTTNNPKDCDETLVGIPRTISESMNRNLARSVEEQ